MHRKLKHNCNQAVKNRTTAQTTLFDDDDDQKQHAEATYGFSSLPGNPKVNWNIIKETEGTREEEKPLNELFHGFLAIGTLGGSEAFNTEPPTPTFPASFQEDDDVTHETAQITDQDLKLITKELEKFLEAEEAASEDAQSSKRSSYASIITLSGKQVLDDDKTQQESAPTILDCPLQKYFFGSSFIELSDADMAVKKEEASSEEVQVLNGKCASHKKRGKAQFAKNFMKKMLKNLNSKSKTHAASSNGGSAESASTKKKFPKVGMYSHISWYMYNIFKFYL